MILHPWPAIACAGSEFCFNAQYMLVFLVLQINLVAGLSEYACIAPLSTHGLLLLLLLLLPPKLVLQCQQVLLCLSMLDDIVHHRC